MGSNKLTDILNPTNNIITTGIKPQDTSPPSNVLTSCL